MTEAYICGAVRTPFGRYGGTLSMIRADDLAAVPIKALMKCNSRVDWSALDDVILGCANQAGENGCNVARLAVLLAGLPKEVPGVTVNRLCGSSLDAIGIAARAIKSGEGSMLLAGGVESMSRAQVAFGKSEPLSPASDSREGSIGWRFVDPRLKRCYGACSMPEAAENVAEQFNVSRIDQDRFALRSQRRWDRSQATGFFEREIVATPASGAGGEFEMVRVDEPRRMDANLDILSELKGVVREDGTVTAGNASCLSDGAAALLLASEHAIAKYGLIPRAKVLVTVVLGLSPRIAGYGPVPATRRALELVGLRLGDMDVIEINEAFASQCLAVIRGLGLPDEAEHVNSNGGAIAVGHPLGASGARLVTTAINQLEAVQGRFALCTMCIGVGQGIATILERV